MTTPYLEAGVTIEAIRARELLDGQGQAVLQVDVWLGDGTLGQATVAIPAGPGPAPADLVWNVHNLLAPRLEGRSPLDQHRLERELLTLDGTPQRQEIGAAAILGLSIALARAAAWYLGLPLYRYLGGLGATCLPAPLVATAHEGLFLLPVDRSPLRTGLLRCIRACHASLAGEPLRAAIEGAAPAGVIAVLQLHQAENLEGGVELGPAIQTLGGDPCRVSLNHLGVVVETLTAALRARQAGREVVMLPGHGEVLDPVAADLAVACGASYLQIGHPGRPRGLALCNRLLTIEEELTWEMEAEEAGGVDHDRPGEEPDAGRGSTADGS